MGLFFFSSKYNNCEILKAYYIYVSTFVQLKIFCFHKGVNKNTEEKKRSGKNKKDVAHLGWVLIKNLLKRV